MQPKPLKCLHLFRNVVTHGFVVDSEGKKMSKSLGNVVSPQSIWNQKKKLKLIAIF